MRLEAEPWWRQAQTDLETGRQLFDLAPRTHDLEYLGTQVRVTTTSTVDLALLNPAFDLVRYPEPASGRAPVDSVTSTLATQHIAAAERVMAWLDAQLNQSSNQS